MRRVSRLHEDFINAARRPMTFGNLPIDPKHADTPIIPVNRWVDTDGKIKKKFLFQDDVTRNDFVERLLDHEVKVKHNGILKIEEGSVEVEVYTKDLGKVTEIDKEYAKSADNIFKDVVYSIPHD